MKRNDFIEQLESRDWAAVEFAGAPLPDRRLNRRVIKMATDQAHQPGAPVTQTAGGHTGTAGAYRFLENERIDPQQIFAGHRQANLERLRGQPVVLLPQDTTSFNFHLPGTTGLGSVGDESSGAQGLWLHSTLAFSPAGLPLGIVRADFWARAVVPGKLTNRQDRPFEERESLCWRQSWQAALELREQMTGPALWVNIADMEGDLYEVFLAAQSQPAPKPELLIRARHNRKLKGRDERLWEHLAGQPVVATLQVQVARNEKRTPRLATLQVRFAEVTLEAPQRNLGQPAVQLWAIEAREMHAAPGDRPILWRLLSTLPVTDAPEALGKVRWYAVRWKIEVFHKILKSVCRAEAHQLGTARALQRALMLDLVAAWRIQVLTIVGREQPDLPASQYFDREEYRALQSFINHTPSVSRHVPSMEQMMNWLGELGGFVKSKSNPRPGPLTLARGLSRLNDLSAMWTIQHPESCVE